MAVVSDYTVDFAGREFGVDITGAGGESVADALARYAAGYQRRLGEQVRAEVLALSSDDHIVFLRSAARCLVAIVYEHVELAGGEPWTRCSRQRAPA